MFNNHCPKNSRHHVPRDLICHKEFLYVGEENSSYLFVLQIGLLDFCIYDQHHIHLIGEIHLLCLRYHQLGLEQWLLQPDPCFGFPC